MTNPGPPTPPEGDDDTGELPARTWPGTPEGARPAVTPPSAAALARAEGAPPEERPAPPAWTGRPASPAGGPPTAPVPVVRPAPSAPAPAPTAAPRPPIPPAVATPPPPSRHAAPGGYVSASPPPASTPPRPPIPAGPPAGAPPAPRPAGPPTAPLASAPAPVTVPTPPRPGVGPPGVPGAPPGPPDLTATTVGPRPSSPPPPAPVAPFPPAVRPAVPGGVPTGAPTTVLPQRGTTMPPPSRPVPPPPPRAARPTATVSPVLGRGRRSKLVVRTIDPWSVLTTSLIYSLCLAVVGVIAVAILWAILSGLGAFDSIAKAIDNVNFSGAGTGHPSAKRFFGAFPIVGGAAVLFAVNALLLTALSTLAAFLYNLCSSFTGGVEVTLSEKE